MRARALTIVCALFALSSCERGMHEMYDQPKDTPLKPGSLFADGNSSRPQVPGTQPHAGGALAGASSGRNGKLATAPAAPPVRGVDAQGRPLARGGAAARPGYSNPLPITPQLLARGEERFNVYCAPCHSRAGDGDGMIARRGFPHPPSFHTDALRKAPDSHFYDVITNGYGAMYPYADRVGPRDRWAIVAYIRALQLSQHAPASALGPEDLQRLDAASSQPPSTLKPVHGSGSRPVHSRNDGVPR
ncbi:MAG TPA: cytochrome c [Rhodanobacteraceae bacterium]|nr:cytochrome c [Rhodanobacteraceae bacterium]